MRAPVFSLAERKIDYIKIGIFCLSLLGVLSVVSYAEETDLIDTAFTDEIFLHKGELETLKVRSLTRLSLTDQDVADIIEADDKEILLIGKSEGTTVLFIWDEHGKRAVTIHVAKENLEDLKNRIEDLLQKAGIHEIAVKPNEREGRLVLTGNIPKEKESFLETVLKPYTLQIVDLINRYDSNDIILIDMQVTELNKTLVESLGIDWGTDGGSLALTYEETLPNLDGSVRDYFKIGDFARTNSLVATVNAIVQEGNGRILSKPRLLVKSGSEASFLVGGEVPYKSISTNSSGGQTESVEFREYGISMVIKPEIKQNNKVEITLSVEITDLDPAADNGGEPGFASRSAETVLFLDDKQTVVMAGLIRHVEAESVKKVPYLGDVPVLGAIFRAKSKPANTDTEVVISMTPTIMSDYYQTRSAKKESDKKTAVHKPKEPYNANTVPHYSGVDKAMTEYIRAVQQKISQAISYPREAQEYGWEGTVKVGLHILNDGTLALALVKESSGYKLFDEAALMTAKNVAPYAQFPANTDLQELNVTIPIVYSLQKN